MFEFFDVLIIPFHALFVVHEEHGWRGVIFVLSFVILFGGSAILMAIQQFGY